MSSRHTRNTRRTRSSRTSTSSSSARRKALAESTAARKQAEFEQIMAEKESEKKQREAEEECHRQQRRAQHERDMAILEAEKRKAVADAKLKAIEQSILEEETPSPLPEQFGVEDARSRTLSWVNAQDQHDTPEQNQGEGPTPPTDIHGTDLPKPSTEPSGGEQKQSQPFSPRGFAGNQPIYRPPAASPDGAVANRCLEGIAQTNSKIVASLARQNLPKCHPDVFGGDATLFHPWKRSFQAMIQDANLSPSQEIAYLRNYTKGKAQDLIDNFRKRQKDDPAATLRELWNELERRFGNTAILTNSLLEKLRESAKFSAREKVKLQVFADTCADVDNQMASLTGLSCLNYPNAIKPIVENLPSFLKFKWEKQVVEYAEENNDLYPTFHQFSVMIQKQARLKNHPNVVAFEHQNPNNPRPKDPKREGPKDNRVYKTRAEGSNEDKEGNVDNKKERYCLFHERKGHELGECKAFSKKTLEERTEWVKKAGLCFRCLAGKHRASQCRENVKCGKCESERHPTILHKDKVEKRELEEKNDGEEQVNGDLQSRCTFVCQGRPGGLSCSKILLVNVYSKDNPENTKRVYAIMDDQSNASMISPELADSLDINGPQEKYLLTTCSGAKETKYGRRVSGLLVKSMNGTVAELPNLVECDHIPQDKTEIPTPAATKYFPHLREISKEIPPLDHDAKISILIGRDAPELLKVRAFKNGPRGSPWAQKLTLGWTVSGQMCLDRVGGPVHIAANYKALRTSAAVPVIEGKIQNDTNASPQTLSELRTVFCPNYFEVKDGINEHSEVTRNDVYKTTPEDNEISMSREDRQFIRIMEKGIHKNEYGNWEMPLPFRSQEVIMPNNREQAMNRLHGLLRSFKRRPQMKKDYLEFLGKVIERGHAVPVPQDEIRKRPLGNSRYEETASSDGDGKVWYLPHFGVYHPKKPNQIRVVFDSSCEFKGASLNKELLAGPDLMNSLLGVLMRFRQESVGVMCDVEQMFHSFHVDPDHRDYLRFLWFKDNDPSQEVIEYRMTVHLFGNSPSPAVATFGMRKTADNGEEERGADVKKFICEDFYVDDGLTSQPSEEEAIDLVKGAQSTLATANLRLHKVASNSVAVMEAFSAADRAKDIRDLDLREDTLPAQRTLGVQWDLEKDALTFNVHPPEKPFTRRGVLSVVNSIYDPLGLAAPFVLVGKLLLQQLIILGKKKQKDKPLGWDDPLPDDLELRWRCWKDELPALEEVSVDRCYHPKNFGRVTRNELHAFADASKDAIGVAVYLKQVSESGEVSVNLAFGQCKVAPIQPTSIPRLELCAAVLATQAVKRLKKELDIDIHDNTFYTDSKVVLGYIRNDARRFHVYVANRVGTIRNASEPDQWKYIETSTNPADLATRGITVKALLESDWLHGPDFLKLEPPALSLPNQPESDIDENDPEVRKQINTYATNSQKNPGLGSERFNRFSKWSSLLRAIANLITRAKRCKGKLEVQPPRSVQETVEREHSVPSLDATYQAKALIIRTVQREAFASEIDVLEKKSNNESENRELLKERRRILRKSSLYRLDPFVDKNGILRVGGRLHRADLAYEEKHPAILPKNNHMSELLIHHYHHRVYHQGRQITHGALRQAGYWVVGGHGMVSKVLNSCVTCRKLRGRTSTQQMADLPADRIEPNPPFNNVGFDVFGPWLIRTRKLRGGAAESKRWGLVFTCLSSRAIHIEVLESMDTSSFINALRRFFTIRGPASLLRCDCGTNFTGAKGELGKALKEMDQGKIERYTREQGCE